MFFLEKRCLIVGGNIFFMSFRLLNALLGSFIVFDDLVRSECQAVMFSAFCVMDRDSSRFSFYNTFNYHFSSMLSKYLIITSVQIAIR